MPPLLAHDRDEEGDEQDQAAQAHGIEPQHRHDARHAALLPGLGERQDGGGDRQCDEGVEGEREIQVEQPETQAEKERLEEQGFGRGPFGHRVSPAMPPRGRAYTLSQRPERSGRRGTE